MINIKIVGDRELIARLEHMPEKLRTALVRKVTALALKLEAKVKDKLTNKVLHVRTGALRRSIFSQVDDTATSVTGKVGSSGDVKYAAIHEFGGRTRAHIIEPKKAKVLAFMMGGKQMFAARVNHPGSVIPERSYLRSSMREMREEITVGLKEAIVEGAREK
jgi:phage gpG-like protein